MIIGIGTDIVELARVKRSLEKEEFKVLVYSKEEMEYCEQQGKSVASYAGRFAAKEAFFKALGTGWVGEMKFSEVAIVNDEAGKPSYHLKGEAAKTAKEIGCNSIHVSISHSENFATAVAIIEK